MDLDVFNVPATRKNAIQHSHEETEAQRGEWLAQLPTSLLCPPARTTLPPGARAGDRPASLPGFAQSLEGKCSVGGCSGEKGLALNLPGHTQLEGQPSAKEGSPAR